MGIQVSCDNPEALETDEPAVSIEKSVQIQVLVIDPETGQSRSQAFFCTDHGDKVVGTLKELGFPEFE
jgi:hypothetical protein